MARCNSCGVRLESSSDVYCSNCYFTYRYLGGYPAKKVKRPIWVGWKRIVWINELIKDRSNLKEVE